MSASLNRAEILGNLGSDPEIRSTSSGTKVATLSVATDRRWTDRKGKSQERTEWHRVVLWDRLAEVAEEFLSKGDRVYVEGRIEYRSWEGNDGQTRYTTEIRARGLIMLGGSSDRRNRRDSTPRREPAPARSREAGDPGEDLPF